MIKVIVGSENPVKINSVRNVFSKYFKNVKVIGRKVNSKVSFQPKSEKEIVEGARNRAVQILKKYEPDFAVGIEGGMEYIENQPYSFAWICVKPKEGKMGLGRTASFPLPPRVEKLIKNGKELGEADDIIFGIRNTKQKMGAIGLLSKGKLNRTKLYEQGVICALTPFLNQDLYSQ